MITVVKWVNCTVQPKHKKTEYNIVQYSNFINSDYKIKNSHTEAFTRKGGIYLKY